MSNNGNDRISQLEGLVLSLAQTFSQAQQQQQTFNQQISDRLSEFIEQSNENFTALSEAHRVTEHQIGELAEAQQLTNESVRSIGESVRMLADETIPQMSKRIEENNQAIREMQSDIREMQAEVRGLQTENRRILDHLFGQQNGGGE